MNALVKTVPGAGAQYLQVDIPMIKDDEVLVKVKASALCKSDVDVYEWTPVVQNLKLPLPKIMGHEFLGEVVETGGKVKGINVGDHIAGETHIPCGQCNCCKTGNPHICNNGMGVLGRSTDGAFAEYIKLPALCAIKIDNSIPVEHGAIMEPLATALHALSKAGVSGKSVAILGCGTIGLMAVELARFLGATWIFAVSTSQFKLDKALKLGADFCINNKTEDMVQIIMEKTHGLGVDVAVELTGNEGVINNVVKIMKPAGKIVFVGMIDYPLTFNNYMLGVVYKELVLTGIFGRRIFDTWEMLNAILETKRLNLEEYIGERLPLKDYEKAIKLSHSTAGRVILIP